MSWKTQHALWLVVCSLLRLYVSNIFVLSLSFSLISFVSNVLLSGVKLSRPWFP